MHGKDDITGDPLIQREDDKPEAVRARLAAYDKVSISSTLLDCNFCYVVH